MKEFEFSLGQAVRLAGSDERGTIVARAEYAESNPQYYVRYKDGTGRMTEQWWTGSALSIVADVKAPAAVEKPLAADGKTPATKPAEAKAPEPKKPEPKKISREDVVKALKDHSALEGKESAIAILKDLGADTVSDLDPDKYGEAVARATA